MVQRGTANMKRQSGATLVEYCLLLLFIVIVALLAVKAFGNRVSGKYTHINTEIERYVVD